MSRKEEIIQTEKEIKNIKNQVNSNKEQANDFNDLLEKLNKQTIRDLEANIKNVANNVESNIENIEGELKNTIDIERKKIDELKMKVDMIGTEQIYNAACTYTNNIYTLSLPKTPQGKYFTIRFQAPNDYIERSSFCINGDKDMIVSSPKYANFEKNDIVSTDFGYDEKGNLICFFKSRGTTDIVLDTLPPQIEDFNAFAGDGKVELLWTVKDKTYLDGYVFTIKENEVPKNINDGIKCEIVRDKNSAIIDGLKNDAIYYIRCFPYNNKKQYQTEYNNMCISPGRVIPLKDLPVGTKIKFGKYQVESETPEEIIWLIGGQNHYKNNYNPTIENHTTLITEKIIDLRAFDGKELNGLGRDRTKYGNNKYSDSNIRQWLNKSGYPWFEESKYDAPPTDNNTGNYNTGYDTKKGFLSDFTQTELEKIIPTRLTVARCSFDGGGSEMVTDSVFLLSKTEVGFGNENDIAEGSELDLFNDDGNRTTSLTNQCFNNTKCSKEKPLSESEIKFYWLRTPESSSIFKVRGVTVFLDNEYAFLSYHNAYSGVDGVRPALNIKSDIVVSEIPDSDGCYMLKL